MLNGLRDRIAVQVDGQIKTGRDVVVAALLGAEEFGFATAPLVVSGCIMMRVCHLDTCPVGVATQNPELRARYSGKPEFVETYFEYIAEEVREHLAALGFRSIEEAVGQVAALDIAKAVSHWKASGLDLAPILAEATPAEGQDRYCTQPQDHGLERALDHELIALARPALDDGAPVTGTLAVRNVNRTVGTMLGHEVTKRYPEGLPDGTIDLTLTGTAGQSFGAQGQGVIGPVHGAFVQSPRSRQPFAQPDDTGKGIDHLELAVAVGAVAAAGELLRRRGVEAEAALSAALPAVGADVRAPAVGVDGSVFLPAR